MAEKNEKLYLSDNAQLMTEWDWKENDQLGLNPTRLTHGSTKRANWICVKGHHYSARIDHRTIMRSGCPFCAGKRPVVGENDLATTHPHLIEEWDYENNIQDPDSFLAGSSKKVNWVCKDCGFHWVAKICSRALKNSNCPVCMRIQRGKTKTITTIKKHGSLAEEFPQLSAEWDNEKNLPLTSTDVHRSSKNIVWWNGQCGHSWKASVGNRVAGNGCPICAGKQILLGFNDLGTKFPAIASEWHPKYNGNLKPNKVTAHSDKKVWWLCPTCGEAYYTSIYSRTSLRTGCPICNNKVVVVGLNDLTTTHPQIAKEWNDKRNGELRPSDIVGGSNKMVWWKCDKEHEWQAQVNSRIRGRGCPICAKVARPISRNKTYLEKNGSLAEVYPKIAAQWHYQKNGEISPDSITSGSSQCVWWMCEKGHEWEAVIYSRTAGRGCPICNNERSTSFPEQILYYYLSQVTTAVNRYKILGSEIDVYLPMLNVGIEYNGRYYHQNRRLQDEKKQCFFKEIGVRVISVYEGEESVFDGDNIFFQYINSDYLTLDHVVQYILRICSLPVVDINIKRDRTKIFEQYIITEKENSVAMKYPWLIDEWDYEKNGRLTPWLVSYGSKKRVHWRCKKCGYQWNSVVYARKKSGCPCCANRVVVEGVNDLSTTHPWLVQEWDAEKNDKRITEIVAGSHQYAWWICEKGHNWRAQIKSRAQGCDCPICSTLNK